MLWSQDITSQIPSGMRHHISEEWIPYSTGGNNSMHLGYRVGVVAYRAL